MPHPAASFFSFSRLPTIFAQLISCVLFSFVRLTKYLANYCISTQTYDEKADSQTRQLVRSSVAPKPQLVLEPETVSWRLCGCNQNLSLALICTLQFGSRISNTEKWIDMLFVVLAVDWFRSRNFVGNLYRLVKIRVDNWVFDAMPNARFTFRHFNCFDDDDDLSQIVPFRIPSQIDNVTEFWRQLFHSLFVQLAHGRLRNS